MLLRCVTIVTGMIQYEERINNKYHRRLCQWWWLLRIEVKLAKKNDSEFHGLNKAWFSTAPSCHAPPSFRFIQESTSEYDARKIKTCHRELERILHLEIWKNKIFLFFESPYVHHISCPRHKLSYIVGWVLFCLLEHSITTSNLWLHCPPFPKDQQFLYLIFIFAFGCLLVCLGG